MNFSLRRITSLQWHLALVLALLLVNLFLLVRLVVAFSASHAGWAERIANQQTQLRAAELQAAPLRGLDQLVSRSNTDADTFYTSRVPATYSAVLAELGRLEENTHVRLTRVQYTEAKAVQGLIEIRMDANLSGDYSPLIHFLNDIERDKVFFLINGLTLSGQQTGVVNLRLRMTVYLRQGADLPAPAPAEAAAAATGGQ